MKIINKILGTVISVLVAVMVLACCWQVITRFLLNDPSQWTEEFLRYALIWMTMLGAPYAYGKDQHLSIRVLVDKFQSKNQIRTKIAVEIIVLILSIAVFIVGGIMVTANSFFQIILLFFINFTNFIFIQTANLLILSIFHIIFIIPNPFVYYIQI